MTDDPAPASGAVWPAPPSRRARERGLRVLVSDDRGRTVPAGGLGAWLGGVAPRGASGTVNVALVPDARMRALNRRYRGTDSATDVLSFPAGPAPRGRGVRSRRRGTLGHSPSHAGPASARHAQPPVFAGSARFGVASPAPCLGDIVIATGVAGRQAREAGHATSTELRILALHGLLHLLGYDHEQDDGRMDRVERRLRRKGRLRQGLIERG